MIASPRRLALPLILMYLCLVFGSQAFLISVLGGGFHLPGTLAIDNEEAGISLEIYRVISLQFTVDTLSFQQGFINETCNNCTMSTQGSGSADANCCHIYWATPPADGLLLENLGTTVLSLSIQGSHNASNWIGGSGPDPSFQYKIISEATEAHSGAKGDDNSDSCLSAWATTDWTELTTVDTYVCGNTTSFDFDYHDQNDEAHLVMRIIIPSNASRGQKALTVQVTGTAP